MKKLALAASFLVLAAAGSAQQPEKPNFSGTWVAISPASQAGIEETIKHTATEISFHHDSSGAVHANVYKLDGTESRNEGNHHGEKVVSLAKATWDGDKLLIHETTTYADGRKMEMRQTLALNAEGLLVREARANVSGQQPAVITVTARRK